MEENQEPIKTISNSQKVLNLWAVILIIWSFYRAKFSFPELLDELIIKPLIFILPVYLYIKKIEQGSFFPSIAINKKNFLKDVVFSLTLCLVFFLTIIALKSLKTGTSFLNIIVSLSGKNIFSYLPIILFTAISEELLSRGFILKRLYEESNNIFKSSLTASVLSLIIHIPILLTQIKITGGLLLFFLCSELVLSMANSFIFISRKSLVPPIFFRAFYSLMLIIFV